jgi:hypothetical protein
VWSETARERDRKKTNASNTENREKAEAAAPGIPVREALRNLEAEGWS